jgi:hypothetical protein
VPVTVTQICYDEIPGLKACFVPPLPSLHGGKVTLVLKKYPPSYKGGPIHKTCNNDIKAIVQAINDMYESLDIPAWGQCGRF